MIHTKRLIARVAAAALVGFSGFCLWYSPAAQAQEKPKYIGKADAASIHALITPQAMGGGVVILFKPDGSMQARAVNPPGGATNISVYQKDESGDNKWYNEDGKQEDPPTPPLSGPKLKGAGNITEIKIYEGSDCVMCNLNGKWITVCK